MAVQSFHSVAFRLLGVKKFSNWAIMMCFYSPTMPSPGSGVFDDILDVTKESLNEWNSQNLTRKGTTLTGLSSKQQSTSITNRQTNKKATEKLRFSPNSTYWQASCKTWYLLWKLYKRLMMPRYCKMWTMPTIPRCLTARMRKTLQQPEGIRWPIPPRKGRNLPKPRQKQRNRLWNSHNSTSGKLCTNYYYWWKN